MTIPPNLSSRLFRGRGLWLSTGWTLLVLGTTGLVGWLSGVRVLVQPFTGRPPLRPLAAIGLVGLGLSSLLLQRGRRRFALAVAGIPALIGYLVLLQFAGVDLAILEPVSRPWDIPGDFAGSSLRVLPLATALGLVLAGLGLAGIASRFREETTGTFLVGLAGSVLVALSLAILVGQVFGLSPEVQFGHLAGVSPQMALGLFALGLGFVSVAWNRVWVPSAYPAWVPPGVGLASLVAVIFLWLVLVQTQRDDHAALLRSVARASQTRLSESVGRVNLALLRLAWLSKPEMVGTPTWAQEVREVVSTEPGVMHIGWVGSGGRPIVIEPSSPDSVVLRSQFRLQLASFWKAAGLRDSIRHFALVDSVGSVATVVPRCDLGTCSGVIVGILRVDHLLHSIGADSADGFQRSVVWRGRALSGPKVRPPSGPFLDRTLLSFNDMTWELLVWPTGALRSRLQTGLPNLLLAFGLVMSGLVALALQLGRTIQANAQGAEQARLRLALGRAADRAWSWDLTGEDRAPSIRESSSGQEIRDGNWTGLVHEEDRRRVERVLRAHLQGLTPTFEARYRVSATSGEWQWLIDRGYVSERAGDGSPLKMLGVSADVSERERVDQERESSERRFRAVFDSAHHFQVLMDAEGRVLEANPAALGLLGPDAALIELLGKPVEEAPWWPLGEVRERIAEAVTRARSGNPVSLEAAVLSHGGATLIFDFAIQPILDGQGRVRQVLVEGLDLTERRRAEAQLRELETLSTMGRLAARVAHEINNPLAGIQNSFLLLRDAIPPNHPHYAYVGAMEREINRIASVTRQLYETYRPESNGNRPAGVRTLIGDAVALLTQLNRPSNVRIEAELDRLPAEVAIPESVLRQSVYNLVQNAVEASPSGGTVTVRVEADAEALVLRVRDQGPGIPEPLRAEVFRPFVSAKGRSPEMSGMGVGLSLVHRSLAAIGGTIEIVDPPGGGTEFVVRMPLSGTTQ